MVQRIPLNFDRPKGFPRVPPNSNIDSQSPPQPQTAIEPTQPHPVLTPTQIEECNQLIQELLAANTPLEALTASLEDCSSVPASSSSSSSSFPSSSFPSSAFPSSSAFPTLNQPQIADEQEPHICDFTSSSSLCTLGMCISALPPALVHGEFDFDSDIELEDFDYSSIPFPDLNVPWPTGMDMNVNVNELGLDLGSGEMDMDMDMDMGMSGWPGLGQQEIWCMMPKTPAEWEETLNWSADGGDPEWIKEFNREVGITATGGVGGEMEAEMEGVGMGLVEEGAVAC
ncbi:hypothetical protein Hypma_011210 [Hypsizygus marmoreus]|uniref:Uncharacterized protein n=1 Tax=Hypsizygus marmoreus TaxID=39966 RepID=A0A369JMQ6_HYPMA|nr:hypothetical protein Hypma_011210 [Hypsizygus marmoreus]